MPEKPKKPEKSDEPEYVPDYKRPVMPFERKATVDGSVGRFGAVGFEFALYVTVFFLGGLWLDGKFGTRPWAAAIGALVGVGMGMYMLIRRVSSLSSPPAGKDTDPSED